MAIQTAVNTQVVIAAETTFGTTAAAANGQALRRTTTSLALNKESFQSNEARVDLQVADLRHGMRSARGAIEGELSIKTYDVLIEALLGGTWAAGVSCSPSDFATGVTIATSGQTSTLTFAGAGSLLTKGFKVGDIVRGTGLTTPTNNAKNLRIVGLTATVMTVYPAISATAQQAAGWSIAVKGKKLLMGATRRSFTIEHAFLDADVSELFTGCRINTGNFKVQPNGMATVSFDVLGQNGVMLNGAASPYFTTVAAAPVTPIVSGLDGMLRLAGQELGIITGIDMAITNNLSVSPVIGANVAPDVFQGRKVVTGSVSAFLQDSTMLDAFSNETEIDMVTSLLTASGSPQDFITLSMQRLKFSGATHSIAAEGGVIAQFPFQALLADGTTNANLDTTTIAIQRSNVT